MTFVTLRFFNVYGPGQLGSSPYSGVISPSPQHCDAEAL
jgi:nucleoside-diphosphate-sugar epimerase